MNSRQKLLIIGSRGFIGGHLSLAASSRFEICSDNELDITSRAAIERAMDASRPAAVILLAAISDIDCCQFEPEVAARVNTEGAANIARACERYGTRLIFTSTGAVFDGSKCGYVEEDLTCPLSAYGETKARAEEQVRKILPDAVIVRLSLVIGFARWSRTNSLTDKLIENFRAGRAIAAPVDEYRNPIDVFTLNQFLLHFVEHRDLAGIFHAGASGYVSRYELARKLAQSAGYSPDLVTPGGGDAPGRAPRGKHHFLISAKASSACSIPLPSVEEAIERTLHVPA